ncbi:hypothetical protein [Salinigranum halophilum]|uniref:hypothetical protein n=1 Tax=Salinigranum halophilum TaxID=2565931 RepID=UPI001375FAE1|nr:hypothetical protein [Salinigranum halophilum]
MVGLKRCSICGEPLGRNDDMVKCEQCHIWCHRACLLERAESHCPRCADEAWISVVEF